MSRRPEPLRAYNAVRAGYVVLTASALFTGALGAVASGWVLLGGAVADAVVNEWVRGKVTPLAAPQAADGRALIPVPTQPVPDEGTAP